MRERITPLSGGFMIVGLFGFLFSVMFLKNYSLNWAFIVGSVSAIVFVASIISTTNAPVEEELLLDEHTSERRRRVKVYTLEEYKEHKERLKAQHQRELENLEKLKPRKETITKVVKKIRSKPKAKKTTSSKKVAKKTTKKSAKKNTKKR